MSSYRTAVCALVAVLAVSLLVASSSGAAALPKSNARHADPAIQFTYNGTFIGRPISAPARANNFEVFWKAGRCLAPGYQFPWVVIVWTYNGQFVPRDPPHAPCRVNDVKIDWLPRQLSTGITRAFWTINGRAFKILALPPKTERFPFVNDVCIELSYGPPFNYITKAWWTLNEKPYGKPIPIPKRANDVCWYGYEK